MAAHVQLKDGNDLVLGALRARCCILHMLNVPC